MNRKKTWRQSVSAQVVAGVILAALLGVAGLVWRGLTTDGSINGGQEPVSRSTRVSQAPVAVGQPGRDNQYVLTVLAIDCGKETDPFSLDPEDRPQGDFCVVRVRVENRGNQADYPSFPTWILYVDERAFPTLRDYGPAFEREIFPGNSAEGFLVFDIPKGSDPTLLELHVILDSPGIRVAV